uniref:Uncharacterized protein n=1 Tax=Anopheles dirus TaxID=7168 RepID=A0A182N833_9DIPT
MSADTKKGEHLIDSDDSYSDAYTDDEEPVMNQERAYTPYDGETGNYMNGLGRAPSQETPSAKTVPQSFSRESFQFEQRAAEETDNGNCFISMGILLAIGLVGFAAVLSSLGKGSIPPVNPLKCGNFYRLEANYKGVDEKLWSLLNVNVRRAIANDNREPGTILFLHHGSSVAVDKFIDSVVNITADCFGGTEPIVLNGKHIKQTDFRDDYGVFLSQNQAALQQRGVLVVRNFEHFPAQVAQAFHTICDTQEPLVDRAVIYLTMDVSKASGMLGPGDRSATAEAEYFLREIWKDSLRPEVLDPLITRLTDSVYRIV